MSKIGYSNLTNRYYVTGCKNKVDITKEINAILEQKDQRVAELESDLENLTAYDLKKSHEYSIKDLIQANENLSKQITEHESEKQKAVKGFVDEILQMLNKYSIKGTIKICDNVLKNNIYLLLKEKGIE